MFDIAKLVSLHLAVQKSSQALLIYHSCSISVVAVDP